MYNTIAGHDRIILLRGWCDCGMKWTYLRTVTKDCIGQPGWAHTQNLNESEYNQVMQAIEEEDARYDLAMADLGRSG